MLFGASSRSRGSGACRTMCMTTTIGGVFRHGVHEGGSAREEGGAHEGADSNTRTMTTSGWQAHGQRRGRNCSDNEVYMYIRGLYFTYDSRGRRGQGEWGGTIISGQNHSLFSFKLHLALLIVIKLLPQHLQLWNPMRLCSVSSTKTNETLLIVSSSMSSE